MEGVTNPVLGWCCFQEGRADTDGLGAQHLRPDRSQSKNHRSSISLNARLGRVHRLLLFV